MIGLKQIELPCFGVEATMPSIGAAGLAAYVNSFDGGCLLDDRGWVVDNPEYQRLLPLRKTIRVLVKGGIRPPLGVSIADRVTTDVRRAQRTTPPRRAALFLRGPSKTRSACR